MPNSAGAWREALPVLVLEAEMRMSIGVIRSLGRAGYPVHAASSEVGATGLRSRFTHRATACPGFDDPEFVPWLRRYVEQHGIRCVVPTELLLLAIRPCFDEFAPLLPVSSDREIVYAGMSKFDLFHALQAAGGDAAGHLAPHELVEADGAWPTDDELARLGLPLYVKVDGAHARRGAPSANGRAEDPERAREVMAAFAKTHERFIVQGHVAGQGAGAFALRWNGELLADFMHLRLHEVPPSGVSSYRRSFWHPAMMEDAKAKLEALDWSGVAMLEYRWDAQTDEFALLEMNGRFWGSIHPPLFAEVDFPALLLDAFHGETRQPVSGRGARVRSRNTFPLEVRYVRARVRDRSLGWLGRAWPLLEFFLLGLHPRVRSDLWFPGDRRLYFGRFWDYVVSVWRKLRPGRQAS